MFPEVPRDRLVRLVSSAYPFEPSSLFLLPRVAARVAQNERTLFSFLQWVSLEEPILPGAIYDYFRGDFSTDAGAGGTQRAWLETESALQKVVPGSPDEEALKCAFLLGLGRSGERAHATYAQLQFALDCQDPDAATDIIDGLIDQKLLVHRRHSDQVVVWHGTDADLRGRLADEKKRGNADFQLAPFLSREMPPPVWRPIEYNARVGIRRYLPAEYVTVDGLRSLWDEHQLRGGWTPGSDGRVVYVLPSSALEFEQAVAVSETIHDERLFIAVTRGFASLREAAIDLWCLLRMHADRELVASDPLVKAELDHLTDDARTALRPLVDRLIMPQARGSIWFSSGKRLRVETAPQLRQTMSRAMERVFPTTPEIDSEMVVRRSPSSVVINARKKVELGILERHGEEDLGIEGNFADKAIFRSVFLRTGLYRKDGSRWRLATPEEIKLPGLSAVWDLVRSFYMQPGSNKGFRSFIHDLLEPPYGVREGLIPLFLSAGLKAFPAAIAVRYRGRFVDDILPSVIEDIAKNPSDYALDVVGLSGWESRYLKGILRVFSDAEQPTTDDAGDLLGSTMDAVLAWRCGLPDAV